MQKPPHKGALFFSHRVTSRPDSGRNYLKLFGSASALIELKMSPFENGQKKNWKRWAVEQKDIHWDQFQAQTETFRGPLEPKRCPNRVSGTKLNCQINADPQKHVLVRGEDRSTLISYWEPLRPVLSYSEFELSELNRPEPVREKTTSPVVKEEILVLFTIFEPASFDF